MKKAFFALTAVLVAGLAGAVTWTSTGSTGTGAFVSSSTYSGYTPSADVSLMITFSLSDLQTATANGTTALIGIAHAYDSSTTYISTGSGASFYATIAATNTEGVYTITFGGKTNTTGLNTSSSNGGLGTNLGSITITASESNAVVLSVDHYTNSSNQLCVGYAISWNGETIATAAHTDVTSGMDDYVYTSALSGASISYVNGVALVPEPTVLALLALGVAGMALRRKA